MGGFRRIGRDLKTRRHLEAYVVAATAVSLAVLSLIGDVVSEGVRWGALFAALGLLVYQITVPERVGGHDDVLWDRTAFDGTTVASRFDGTTVASRFDGASRVMIFGPSAVNILDAGAAESLRRTVLAKPCGLVRVIVLDPTETEAIRLASCQLDDATDYPIQRLPDALSSSISRLESMAEWDTPGTLQHRYAPYNPGFSLLAVDPHTKRGTLTVEFHGFHNESTGSRMHIELRRQDSEHWFAYWLDQFDHLWGYARRPGSGGD